MPPFGPSFYLACFLASLALAVPSSSHQALFSLCLPRRTPKRHSSLTCLGLVPDYHTRSLTFGFHGSVRGLQVQVLRSYSASQCTVRIFQEHPTGTRRFVHLFPVDSRLNPPTEEMKFRFQEARFNATAREEDATEFYLDFGPAARSTYNQTQQATIDHIHPLTRERRGLWMFPPRLTCDSNATDFMERPIDDIGATPVQPKKTLYFWTNETLFFAQPFLSNAPSAAQRSDPRSLFVFSANLCPQSRRYSLDAPEDLRFCRRHFQEDVSGALLPSGVRVGPGSWQRTWFCGNRAVSLLKTKAGAFEQ